MRLKVFFTLHIINTVLIAFFDWFVFPSMYLIYISLGRMDGKTIITHSRHRPMIISSHHSVMLTFLFDVVITDKIKIRISFPSFFPSPIVKILYTTCQCEKAKFVSVSRDCSLAMLVLWHTPTYFHTLTGNVYTN